MEKVMKSMKRLYEENPWIFADKNAMAVLENLREEFDARETAMEALTDSEKKKAHDELEERMNRMHDKKQLEHQLKSMRAEHAKVTEMAMLRNRDKAQREGKTL
jgi:hypothetical protein